MKTLITTVFLLALAFVLTACVTPNNPGGGATTQPSVTVDQLVTLALTDFDALVASGVIHETPEVDAAIQAVATAQADYAAGKGTLVSINDASLKLAIALAKARQVK